MGVAGFQVHSRRSLPAAPFPFLSDEGVFTASWEPLMGLFLLASGLSVPRGKEWTRPQLGSLSPAVSHHPSVPRADSEETGSGAVAQPRPA